MIHYVIAPGFLAEQGCSRRPVGDVRVSHRETATGVGGNLDRVLLLQPVAPLQRGFAAGLDLSSKTYDTAARARRVQFRREAR